MAQNAAYWSVTYTGYGSELLKAQIFSVINACHIKNIINSIGGYIIFDDSTGMVNQYLEGPKEALLETYERIQKDQRIDLITFRSEGQCKKRYTKRYGLVPFRLKEDFENKVSIRGSPFKLTSEEFHKMHEIDTDKLCLTPMTLQAEIDLLESKLDDIDKTVCRPLSRPNSRPKINPSNAKNIQDSMLEPDRSAKLACLRPSDGGSLRDRWFGNDAAAARACNQGAKTPMTQAEIQLLQKVAKRQMVRVMGPISESLNRASKDIPGTQDCSGILQALVSFTVLPFPDIQLVTVFHKASANGPIETVQSFFAKSFRC